MSETRIQYNSKFIDDVITIILFKEDSDYEKINPEFKKCGFGFMIPGLNYIIIDGEKMVNTDLLNWVEAHEASHLLLKHQSEYDPNEEIEADLGAYVLLSNFSYLKSCELVRTHFKERHGIEFPINKLLEIGKKLGFSKYQEEFFNI
jgi:hypothetical protein